MNMVVGVHTLKGHDFTMELLIHHISTEQFRVLSVKLMDSEGRYISHLNEDEIFGKVALNLRHIFREAVRDDPAVRENIRRVLKEASKPD